MISIYNVDTGKWEIKTLAEMDMSEEKLLPEEPKVDMVLVNKGWQWLCLNGVWIGNDTQRGYTEESIIMVLKIIATK